MTRASGSSRRELAAAVIACTVGAAVVLHATGQPWVRAVMDLPPPMPPGRYTLSGRDLAPQAVALGLAGLAGVAATIATRGVARVAVGVLLALLGAGVVAFSALGIRRDHALGELAARTSFGGEHSAVALTTTAWWTVSLSGGVLVLAAGMLIVARGRRWPRMSGRYDRPGTARAAATEPRREPSEMWDSLDRGADPTADADAGRDGITGKGSRWHPTTVRPQRRGPP